MSLQLSSYFALALAFSPTLTSAQTTLTVAAAADLSALQPALQTGFRKTNPAIRLRFVTGASALLAQQIENGAPYDLFLSANAQFVDRLASSRKLLPDSIRTYAVGRIAILWRDLKRHQLNDLTQNWVRFVALPNAQLAPYGAAARQALEHAGIWKLVQPKVVYGENVRQALQLFESGNADAVLTAASLLAGKPADLVPAEFHSPIVQKTGIVAGSSNEPAARKFLDFLLSSPGQAIFARFGFGAPPEPGQ